MNNESNLILLSDSYKYSHARQYPPDSEYVYSYLESRGGAWPRTVFFGLQYILKKYLEGQVITQEKIDEAESLINSHMGRPLFNKEGFQYILDEHEGKLPVQIKAVPEGSIIPTHNVLMTICNTDPKCFWLPNFLETLLVQCWYPITVATQSYHLRKLIDNYLELTGDVSLAPFKLHDFGFRGVSSIESAGIGGAAHLLSFLGTDTVAALTFLRDYYGSENVAGFSIPASEHSTMTSWGREHEADAMANMLQSYPDGIIACVSDSYNIFDACSEIWGTTLKDQIMGRNGTLVVRPDSGNPIEIVMSCLEILGEKFGYTINAKGYKVLDPHIRIIQGDGVDSSIIDAILSGMMSEMWSADNIAFGMGGALLQKLNRDTLKFAFKCSAIKRSGTWHDVNKDPVTAAYKKSKAGRFKLIQTSNSLIKTVPYYVPGNDLLQTVFENGTITKNQNLTDIRNMLGTV